MVFTYQVFFFVPFMNHLYFLMKICISWHELAFTLVKKYVFLGDFDEKTCKIF